MWTDTDEDALDQRTYEAWNSIRKLGSFLEVFVGILLTALLFGGLYCLRKSILALRFEHTVLDKILVATGWFSLPIVVFIVVFTIISILQSKIQANHDAMNSDFAIFIEKNYGLSLSESQVGKIIDASRPRFYDNRLLTSYANVEVDGKTMQLSLNEDLGYWRLMRNDKEVKRIKKKRSEVMA